MPDFNTFDLQPATPMQTAMTETSPHGPNNAFSWFASSLDGAPSADRSLTAMLILGRREAGAILAARIIMGAVFAGNPSAMLYSAAGGVLAYAALCLLVGVVPEKRLWAVSAVSAVAHNMGQLLACVLVVKTPGVFIYAPALIVSGVITGVFTGFGAMYLVRALRKLKL